MSPVSFDGSNIADIQLGATPIKEAYYGPSLVWRKSKELTWFSPTMEDAIRSVPGFHPIGTNDGSPWRVRSYEGEFKDYLLRSVREVGGVGTMKPPMLGNWFVIKPGGKIAHRVEKNLVNGNFNSGELREYRQASVQHMGSKLLVERFSNYDSSMNSTREFPCENGKDVLMSSFLMLSEFFDADYSVGDAFLIPGYARSGTGSKYFSDFEIISYGNVGCSGIAVCGYVYDDSFGSSKYVNTAAARLLYNSSSINNPAILSCSERCKVPESARDLVRMKSVNAAPYVGHGVGTGMLYEHFEGRLQKFDFSCWIGQLGSFNLIDTGRGEYSDWPVAIWHDQGNNKVNVGESNGTAAWAKEVPPLSWHHLYLQVDETGYHTYVKVWMDGVFEWEGNLAGSHFSRPWYYPASTHCLGNAGFWAVLPYQNRDRQMWLDNAAQAVAQMNAA